MKQFYQQKKSTKENKTFPTKEHLLRVREVDHGRLHLREKKNKTNCCWVLAFTCHAMVLAEYGIKMVFS